MTTPARRISPLDALAVLLLAIPILVPRPLWSQGVGADYTAVLNTDVDAATTIFQGVVMNTRPSKNATTSIITSAVEIRKSVVLKGTLGTSTKTITIDGGTVGDLTYNVEWIPHLEVGDRVIVLLDGSGNLMPGRYLYRLGKSDDGIEDTPGLNLSDIRGLI